MPLIEAYDGSRILRVSCPFEFYWVLDSSAPLAGMRYPRRDFPWAELAAAGFGGVIAVEPGNYDPSPLKLLFSQPLEDLYHGRSPQHPRKEKRLILEAVDIAVRSMRSGRGVVIHCYGGRGRTGTVIGGVLRRLGYGAQDVVGYLDRMQKARGKGGWPESKWQSALVQSSTFDHQ